MSNLISAIRTSATKQPAKAAVIFLHGLGDSAEGWSWFPQLAKQAGLSNHEYINYVFPNAPQLPITVNGGYVMPAWFDIYEFGNPDAKQDVDGFFNSCNLLKDLVKEQIDKHNIPPEKIFIGGFSQGAAISLATTSMLDFKIGGAIILSGFCPHRNIMADKIDKNGANLESPIFQGHGSADKTISYSYGKQTAELFQGLGFKNLKFHTYNGVAHSASEEELFDVIKFLDTNMNK